MKGKRLLATILVLCLCLCACSGREVSTSGSAGEQIPSESSPSQVVESLEEPEKSESSDESSPTLSEENDVIEQQPTEQSSAPSEEKADEPISNFSAEELEQIGKIAIEKWETIGQHIFSTPLYNSELFQLGQDELRKIYCVYIFANHLDTSLVSERIDENGVLRFWMDIDTLRQFVQEYFGLDFDNQENNLPEGCISGSEIQFDYKSQYNVLPRERSQFELISCIQNPDKTFVAHVEAKQLDNPNNKNIVQDFDMSLVFMVRNDSVIFLSASLS